MSDTDPMSPSTIVTPDDGYPSFDQLPVVEGAPPDSSWGVFGADDQVGTLNFLGSDTVERAAELVRRGDVFSLNWDVSLPAPGLFARHPPTHTLITKYDDLVIDDWVDGFFTQGSSQWDGLRHFQDIDFGFYNGATLEEVRVSGPGPLGMEHWAKRGIAGRAVLLDVVRHYEREGRQIDPFDYFPITAEVLELVADAQSVELRPGDILMVRTGWVEAYTGLDGTAREKLAAAGRPGSPGLYGEDLPGFLWDRRIAAVAADNPAFEAARPEVGADLSLHKALIPRLGMPLGELWDLGALARDCAADGVFDVLLTSAPMNLAGASGSPANALALK